MEDSENIKNGIGRQQNSESIYEGEWKNNLKNGYGREIYSDGSYYLGFFKNNKKDG